MNPLPPIVPAKDANGHEYFVDARGHAYRADSSRVPELDALPLKEKTLPLVTVLDAIFDINQRYKNLAVSIILADLSVSLDIQHDLQERFKQRLQAN